MRLATSVEYLDSRETSTFDATESMPWTTSRGNRARPIILATTAIVAALFTGPALAQRGDPSLLTVERIYDPREFAVRSFGPSRWLDASTIRP